MAPTDPNTAPRLRVTYTGPFGTHTMLFHGNLGTDAGDLAGDVSDFIDQAKELQYDGTVWSTAEFADEGSNLFFAYPGWTPITSTTGNDPGVASSPSAFVQFGGRDASSGTRVKLYLFEVTQQATQTMRINAGESALVDAVITELKSVDNNIANIAGRTPIWYSYANVGQNDFLTHKARS